MSEPKPSVVILGGGFAGVGCAKELAKHDFSVTLLDRNNYHQFQPLLYQVATGELAPIDVARPLRAIFKKHPNVVVHRAEVTNVDPETRTVTTADGRTFTGDYLVLAAGSRANFFNTPGASEHAFPLYTVEQAQALRTRLLTLLEDVDAHPERIEQGALNFVIVGAGPTGVETAGSIADAINKVLPKRLHKLAPQRAQIFLIDHGPVVLAAFSDRAHAYAAERLEHSGVVLKLNTGVSEVLADRVKLSDGSEILTRIVIWGGGIQAPEIAAQLGVPQGQGGRVAILPDLTIDGMPRVYALGDMAITTDRDGNTLPQLGSVALQAGRWAGKNIVADTAGKPRKPFHYKDKGIMAMIGDGAAVAEMGKNHHELHGHIAFASWLGIHAYLMSGIHERVDAFVAWAWDFLGDNRSGALLDTSDEARIDWGDEDD
jgi:NADH dehydrogenase